LLKITESSKVFVVGIVKTSNVFLAATAIFLSLSILIDLTPFYCILVPRANL
jgi:hypothetical protein